MPCAFAPGFIEPCLALGKVARSLHFRLLFSTPFSAWIGKLFTPTCVVRPVGYKVSRFEFARHRFPAKFSRAITPQLRRQSRSHLFGSLDVSTRRGTQLNRSVEKCVCPRGSVCVCWSFSLVCSACCPSRKQRRIHPRICRSYRRYPALSRRLATKGPRELAQRDSLPLVWQTSDWPVDGGGDRPRAQKQIQSRHKRAA